MTTYSITKADEGTTIANNGVLNTIHFTTPPSMPGFWFTLVDDSYAPEQTLFNMQTSSMPFASGTDIMTNGGIPFVNLTVRSISPDSQFDVDYTVQDPGPSDPVPTITSISPTSDNTGTRMISVRGTNYTRSSEIVFGNVPQTTIFQSATWLQAQVSAPQGIYDVLVRDTGGDSNIMQFEFK